MEFQENGNDCWLAESGNYRITFRDEYQGVRLPPAYYSVVRCVNDDGHEYWGFVGRRGPYKTKKKAEQEAQRHQTYWQRAIRRCKATREVIRALEVKSRVKGHRILLSRPVWVRDSVDAKLLKRLEKAL
jgi:hypothetical protein